MLESSSNSDRWSGSQTPDFEYVVGERNTEEKYALKSVALSFADLTVILLNVIS
jgi:hypothetical protein